MVVNAFSSGGLPPSPYVNIPPYPAYPGYPSLYSPPYPYATTPPLSPYPYPAYPPMIGPFMGPGAFPSFLPFTGWWIPREDLPPEAGGSIGNPIGGDTGGAEGQNFSPGGFIV